MKCVLCDKNDATTTEHIPPKSMYLKPRPSNLITVPACNICNTGTSKEDEQFKVFLSFLVGDSEPETKQYFEKHVSPTIKHAHGLRKKILENVQEVPLFTESGIYYGTSGVVEVSMGAFDVVINKCVRGLYYQHFDKILGEEVCLEVSYSKHLSEHVYEQGLKLVGQSIGNDAFVYRYGRAKEDPLSSLWILQFYKRFFAVVFTSKCT